MTPLIDLHAHSTASDGTDTPAELMAAAGAAGLDVVAITDHDTTGGWQPAFDAAPPGLTVVPGIELSCVWRPPGNGAGRPYRISLHLLAYLVDPTNVELVTEMERVRVSRSERGRRIVELMVADGVPISWEQVNELAAGGTVGRPHVGRALVAAGLVGSVSEAFETYLYRGSPYYARKQDIEVLRAIGLVRAAGGVPVFAHPLARRRGPVVDDDAVIAMAEAGLGGLEVDHVDHDQEDIAHLRGLAADLGLLVTGSSDYHGTNKLVRLGDRATAPEAYAEILAQATGSTPVSR